MHARAAEPWTVATLAEQVGVSRATLAKRFADLVGEPPLTYLTRWRTSLAADLLAEQDTATIAQVARTVGHSDAFGFSAAFTRVRGATPSEVRRLQPRKTPAAVIRALLLIPAGSSHSREAFSSPRSSTCWPCGVAICPKAGSTIAWRRA